MVRTTDDLKRTIVDFRGGAPIRVGDVAEVEVGSPPAIGDAIINDEPGLLLIVEKQPEGNTLEVTRRVEAALEALKPGLTGLDVDPTIFRPATFIERSISNLSHALWVGCGLVVAILVLFLFDWRTAFISLTAIPLSLISAVVVISALGITLNTMVIAGLVIALGEVVDDAIIDVENIVRRLRLNRAAGNPVDPMKVVLDASTEVRSAVVYATMIVIIVFLPIFFLDGIAGSFFRPLALSYILAILASLGVALTVTPALSYMLLTGHPRPRPRFAAGDRGLRRLYRGVLPWLVVRPWTALGVVAATFAVSAAGATHFGQEFLPEFQETDFLMHFIEKPGTSVEEMDRMTIRASKELRAIEGVRNFGSHIGRAEVADEVVGPNFTELWISIEPAADYPATLEEDSGGDGRLPRHVLRRADVPQGAQQGSAVRGERGGRRAAVRVGHGRAAGQGRRVREGHEDGRGRQRLEGRVASIGAADRNPLAARGGGAVRPDRRARPPGDDDALARHQGRRSLRGPGPVRRGRLGRAGRAGTTSRHCSRCRSTRRPGCRSGCATWPTWSWCRCPTRSSARRRRGGSTSPATSPPAGTWAASPRRSKQKVRGLSYDARATTPSSSASSPHGRPQTRRLYGLGLLALLGIVLVIYSDFGSLRLTLIVAFTLPFALVGGGVGVHLTGGVLSLGSLVGFVTVLGIAARNGIMLVSHYRHLEDEEGEPFGEALVRRGSEERLVPILMTALATGLALLPLIVNGLKPGHEVEYPLSVVILGGLATSTLLNLFLLPPLYLKFGRRTPSAAAT